MSKLTPPYKRVRHGGFAVSDLIPRGRIPDEVKKVSDTEVYAIYSDIDNSSIKFKQTFTAEQGTDSSSRKNVTEKIEKSTDGGNTWKTIYTE